MGSNPIPGAKFSSYFILEVNTTVRKRSVSLEGSDLKFIHGLVRVCIATLELLAFFLRDEVEGVSSDAVAGFRRGASLNDDDTAERVAHRLWASSKSVVSQRLGSKHFNRMMIFPKC